MQLIEELVEEVLLRIPPSDPASLVRAALVCKQWCRIVAGPGFRRRFRALHRTPPMLGLCYVGYAKYERIARFAPTTSFNPHRGIRRYWQAIDSRHGRVLLHSMNQNGGPFVIWDPITDVKQELPRLRLPEVQAWGAAVICAAPGNCDHLDCQPDAFNVVVAVVRKKNIAAGTNVVCVYIYSSKVNTWSQAALNSLNTRQYNFHRHPSSQSALVAGNALYFASYGNIKILKYDMGTREISMIDGPPICSNLQERSVLITTEDGRLGVAYVLNFKLHIWSSKVGPNRDANWTTSRVIDLATLPLLSAIDRSPSAVSCVHGVGIVILRSSVESVDESSFDELFSIDLKSAQVRKVLIGSQDVIHYVTPFMSFYTPALRVTSKEKSPSNAGTSST